jgi:hypothetical protein
MIQTNSVYDVPKGVKHVRMQMIIHVLSVFQIIRCFMGNVLKNAHKMWPIRIAGSNPHMIKVTNNLNILIF